MIKKAAFALLSGGVIAYPTETVYGLGANALDEKAILKVFQIKKRPLSMPIFLAVSSFEMLRTVAEISDQDMAVLEHLMPGPTSVLLKKRSIVPQMLTAGSPLLGVRFPDHHVALEIIDAFGPITSTSANKTGHPPPTTAEEISEEIARGVDLIIDGGRCRYAEPSTLLDLHSRRIIRAGAELEKVRRAIS